MRGTLEYWARVAAHAWRNTSALFPFARSPKKAAINSIIFVVTIGLVYFVLGYSRMMEELNIILLGAFSATSVFLGAYLMNFFAAPARIEKDQETKNKDAIKDLNAQIEESNLIIEDLTGGLERRLRISVCGPHDLRSNRIAAQFYMTGDMLDNITIVGVMVENLNVRERLRHVSVVIDKIDSEDCQIYLKKDTEEPLPDDFASQERRAFLVAYARKTFQRKPVPRGSLDRSQPFEDVRNEDSNSLILYSQNGRLFDLDGWPVGSDIRLGSERDMARRVPPIAHKIRISALSVDCPMESQWFKIERGINGDLALEPLALEKEEALVNGPRH